MARPIVSTCCGLFIAFGAAYWHPARAVEPSGSIMGVQPAAAASGIIGRRILEVTGPIFMGDRVETGAAGEAQIKFRDDTRLVVGPNSLMTIDRFVFSDDDTVRQISMKAAKGAFRFITGNSRKQAYSISTPSSTIGIRGTRFDFAVRPNGETIFALFEGQARLCDRAGRCMDVRPGCAMVVAPPRGGIRGVEAGPDKAALLAAMFPYVVSQARLRPEFRVDTSACNVRRASIRPSTRKLLSGQGHSQAQTRGQVAEPIQETTKKWEAPATGTVMASGGNSGNGGNGLGRGKS